MAEGPHHLGVGPGSRGPWGHAGSQPRAPGHGSARRPVARSLQGGGLSGQGASGSARGHERGPGQRPLPSLCPGADDLLQRGCGSACSLLALFLVPTPRAVVQGLPLIGPPGPFHFIVVKYIRFIINHFKCAGTLRTVVLFRSHHHHPGPRNLPRLTLCPRYTPAPGVPLSPQPLAATLLLCLYNCDLYNKKGNELHPFFVDEMYKTMVIIEYSSFVKERKSGCGRDPPGAPRAASEKCSLRNPEHSKGGRGLRAELKTGRHRAPRARGQECRHRSRACGVDSPSPCLPNTCASGTFRVLRNHQVTLLEGSV